MSNVNTDAAGLLSVLRDMHIAITSIDKAKASITRKYQQLGAGWSDKKYQELGAAVLECTKALNNCLNILQKGKAAVSTLVQSIQEYEETGLRGSSPELSGRHLTPAEVNTCWQMSAASIDEQIENYRTALMNRGVPECKWLRETLARHRAAMLEQAGYDLDVASGHAAQSLHSSEAYQFPTDYPQFYDQLTNEFRLYSLQAVNPNYSAAPQWRNNCQRCVPAFEMRRRGAEVVARPSTYGSEHLSYRPFDVWQNADVIHCQGTGMQDIQSVMASWGDGARAQVVVYWESPHGGGHTFIAEQRNGETCFSDPQTGRTDVSGYFNRVQSGRTQFCRIDNLAFSSYIEECYQEV